MATNRNRLEVVTSILQAGHAIFYGSLPGNGQTFGQTVDSDSAGPDPYFVGDSAESGAEPPVGKGRGAAAARVQGFDMAGTSTGLRGLPLQSAVFLLLDCLTRAKYLELSGSGGGSKTAKKLKEDAMQR
jgi:hypothetical protein